MPDAHPIEPDEAEMKALIAEWQRRGGQVKHLKTSKARRRPLPSPWDSIDVNTCITVLDTDRSRRSAG